MTTLKNELHARNMQRFLFARGMATRAQMARELRIRKGTVGDICRELLEDGVIQEAGITRKRNVLLQLNAARFQALGVEHLPNGLFYAVLGGDCTPLFERFVRLDPGLGGVARLQLILETTSAVLEEQTSSASLVGLGFCDLAMVDPKSGCSVGSPMVAGWTGIPLYQSLTEAFGRRLTLLGRLDAGCIAERVFGASCACDTFVFVLVDRHIGLSVSVGDGLMHGNTGVFGELGHVIADPNGEICKCGNRGCLETVAGTEAIVKKMREHLPPAARPEFGPNGEDLTVRRIIELAKNGHRLAELAVAEAGDAVGNAVAHVISVLGIRDIVFAGTLTGAGELFFERVRAAIHQRCVPPLNTLVQVSASTMGSHRSAIGAAYEVLNRHFGATREGGA